MNTDQLAPLINANIKRTKISASRTVRLAQIALTTPKLTQAERLAAQTRVQHPDLPLAHLAGILGISKDSYSSRLRTAIRKRPGGRTCSHCSHYMPLRYETCQHCSQRRPA